jgi:hypothetical protein
MNIFIKTKKCPKNTLTLIKSCPRFWEYYRVFLNLSVPTIYSKVSKNELPYMKRSKRLYFSSSELLEYLKHGRKLSNAEIEQEAEAYLSKTKKGLNNGKQPKNSPKVF